MIQVRNVPDALHAALKRRAEAAGLTLTDYVQRVLERDVERLTAREFAARLEQLERAELDPPAEQLIREERDGR